MSTGNRDKDKLLTIQILETPAGVEVLNTLGREFSNTGDVMRSFNKAKETAERHGILQQLEIALAADLFRVLGPEIIKLLQSHKK